MQMTVPAASAVPLADVDLYPASFYRLGDPHAAWRTLRAQAPTWRQHAPDGTEFWSVTRYHDVVAVLKDTRRFSSEYSTMLSALAGDTAKGKAIHLTDPPRHGVLRTATVQALSTRVMRDREPRVRARIAAMVDAAIGESAGEGATDFAALAMAVPMAATGEVLGVPPECWADVARWTMASMAPEDPAYRGDDPQATLMDAHISLFALFADLIQQRRDRPTGDVVSLLAALELDGRAATDEEVLVNCYAFIMGAIPTVPQVASHLALAAAHDPDLWRRLATDPQVRSTALEEALRWSSPINHLLRRTTEPVLLGGETVPEGALVAAWIGSANHDEDVFPSPHTFIADRRPNPHIAFGAGPHRCIGNPPARAGLSILLDELTRKVAAIEPVGDAAHLESNFLNGITRLPLRLHPRAG
ncbi:cytochrome P450 [Actinomadura sp. GTD37]|uniref:cytochrome P450 n=1 Tax=Actinomadura sp. GTD37 TaxID=1778030 RepID=UPI0035BF878F